MPQIIDLTDAREVSSSKDVGYIIRLEFMCDPDDFFFSLSRFKHMQIRVNAETVAFYRLVAFISYALAEILPAQGILLVFRYL